MFQKDNMKLHQYPAINSSRGDILNLFNGKMDLIIEDKNLDISINRLAQNSIGQAMTTTPLQMAKVAASIATGKIIDPQLLKSKNGTNYLLNKKENLDVPHLQWLRDGMKSVVEKGTAAFAFKDKLACQVYGKTGTAQVGQRDKEGKWNNKRNSAWFIGWYQPEKKQPKFAFACMVTHANGSGGKVCAPIIRNILKEWNKKNLPPLKLGGKK